MLAIEVLPIPMPTPIPNSSPSPKPSPKQTPFRLCIAGILALCFAGSASPAQTAPPRPSITAISHVAFYVTDMPKSLGFWHELLGFDLSYDRKAANSTDTTVAFLKVNDHQYVELLSDRP
jgi:hypothetical protein